MDALRQVEEQFDASRKGTLICAIHEVRELPNIIEEKLRDGGRSSGGKPDDDVESLLRSQPELVSRVEQEVSRTRKLLVCARDSLGALGVERVTAAQDYLIDVVDNFEAMNIKELRRIFVDYPSRHVGEPVFEKLGDLGLIRESAAWGAFGDDLIEFWEQIKEKWNYHRSRLTQELRDREANTTATALPPGNVKKRRAYKFGWYMDTMNETFEVTAKLPGCSDIKISIPAKPGKGLQLFLLLIQENGSMKRKELLRKIYQCEKVDADTADEAEETRYRKSLDSLNKLVKNLDDFLQQEGLQPRTVYTENAKRGRAGEAQVVLENAGIRDLQLLRERQQTDYTVEPKDLVDEQQSKKLKEWEDKPFDKL